MQNVTNLNIEQSQADVQTKQPAGQNNGIAHKAIIKARAESILNEIEEDLFTVSLNSGKLLEAKELKKYVSFRALLEVDGHKLQTSGTQVRCCCPFHPDRTPSFFIFETDDYAKCYGCGWGGENLTVAGDVVKDEVGRCFRRPSFTSVHAVAASASAKNGHADNGAQRAKCLECGRTFILQPKGARYDQKFKDQVVAAYQDRMSIRGITRTFGVCYQTVLRWVGEKNGGSACLRGHAAAQRGR